MAIENFTTWTEGDPQDRLTVAASSITIDELYRDEDGTWVYKDYGAGYFSGDFVFKMKFTTPVDNTKVNASSIIYPLMLSNAVDEPNAIDAGGGDYQGFTFQRIISAIRFGLTLCESGSLSQTFSAALDYNTTYFLTITRDDDGGTNSTGQLKLEIYTGNYSGDGGDSEVSTLTEDCAAGEQNDFQYVVLAVPEGYDGAWQCYSAGVIEDFDPESATPTYVDMAFTDTVTFSETLSLGKIVPIGFTNTVTFSESMTISFGPLSGTKAEKYTRRLVAFGNDTAYYESI